MFFNFSHKRPTFAFTPESGYTLAFQRKIAHKGTHAETRGISDGGTITTLGLFHTFTNIPGPGVRTANFAAFGAWSGVLPKNAGSLGTAMRSCASLFRGVAAPLGCVIFSVSVEIYGFTPRTQGFLCVRGGGGITALGAFRTFTNIPGPGVRTANFAAFGSWPGVLSKNAESLRNSDALMRVAVPKASRPRWAA